MPDRTARTTRRGPAIIARLYSAAVVALICFAGDLSAQRLPSYTAAREAMPAVWAERYPLTVKEFRANPGGRGVLRANFQGRNVYYYRFQAVVARPVRAGGDDDGPGTQDDTEIVEAGERVVEFWARYRSWLSKPWDLSFVREDRLPGRYRRWIQVGK